MWIPRKPAKLTQIIDCIDIRLHLSIFTKKNTNVRSPLTKDYSPPLELCLSELHFTYRRNNK